VFRTLGWVDDYSGGCGRFQKQAKNDELPCLGKRGFDQPLVAFYPMAARSGGMFLLPLVLFGKNYFSQCLISALHDRSAMRTRL
jgi:hypothetical protein